MLSTHIDNFVDVVAKEWKNNKVVDVSEVGKFKVDLQESEWSVVNQMRVMLIAGQYSKNGMSLLPLLCQAL